MKASNPSVLGLDIGGANLKAAHANGAAHTRPFALWQHPDQLTAQLREIRGMMPPHDLLAVTMTGELCDCFASKSAGVLAILESTVAAADGTPVCVWTRHGELLQPDMIRATPLSAAAANWLALAHLAARFSDTEPAVVIDTGSTTTDLTFLDQGRPQPRGYTDLERMTYGELVYTAIRRTPVCAVLGMGVAAEFFATMIDVYLVLNLWPESATDCDTADGRPATRDHAHARLARLWCADVDDVPPAQVRALAQQALDCQTRFVRTAVDRVLADRVPPRRVILAGSGEALGRQVRAGHPALLSVPVVSLSERLGPELSQAACAYAVAVLASGRSMRWRL